MIGWEDIYKVTTAMAPLYVALTLGYGSVKWWRLFSADHCDVVNRLFFYIILPFFNLDFVAHTDPFKWNYKFIGADVISKTLIVGVIGLWVRCSRKGRYCWSITSFSLSLSNTLVIGVPLLKAMYGPLGVQIVVLSTIAQCLFWLVILMFALECHQSMSSRVHEAKSSEGDDEQVLHIETRPLFWSLMKVVWLKVAKNPNTYACVIGFVWAIIASRWKIQMPTILDNSIRVMSNAGTATAMFSTGMFMALQPKIIACGPKLALFGMILKFVTAPAAIGIAAVAVGMRGDLLRVVIIQAALPECITCFVYAKEYQLHADVLSTAVVFGTVVSLPIMIAYYAVLEWVN